ncbi:hypothetical protein HanXRQr2_Chr12g0553821 [Helianthus annuus]|uniref:Uncharacterized protein n=1 Tax=Helianthus annuus TaxID=4232 RepID=A0A9K3HIE6_HELAN|nr:hypothetical protein HanXRQr2_Chr12g0553821 [Helianthus annuus]KAJ0506223.1 hypothetical protein HanHA89_Chr12g0479511 [Helianthus annuus]KAJ0675894.1 hypothetical protein HanLR1_Chr12g0456421 [Helianthus annuus]KAJ0863707.1 hypothetical protein HanPSC8_Chr12g0533201 [Helianthus annuus]
MVAISVAKWWQYRWLNGIKTYKTRWLNGSKSVAKWYENASQLGGKQGGA